MLLTSNLLFSQQPAVIDSIDNIISKTKDDSLLADLYNQRGEKWVSISLDSSMASYQKSLTISENKFKNGDMKHVYNVANAYTSFSAIYNQKGDNLEAINWAKKSLKVLKSAPNSLIKSQKLITEYNSTGTLFNFLSAYDSALYYHSKAINLSEKINDQKLYATSINNLALVLYYTGEVDSAQALFIKALKLREKFAPKNELAQSYNNVAIIYMRSGNLTDCLKYLKKALKMREEIGNSKDIANSLGNIAYVLNNQGDFEKAVEYYQKAIEINKRKNLWTSVCVNLNNIGIMYNDAGHHDLAESTFNEQLALSTKIKSINDQIAALEGLASVANKKNDLKTGKEYLIKAYDLSIKIENRTRHTNILRNLGTVYYKLGEPEKAITFLNEALELSIKHNITTDLSDTYLALGDFYKEVGNMQKAEENLSKALDLSKKLGFPKDIIRASKQLSEIYVGWGHFKKAYEMKALHFEMHDSISKIENLDAVNELNAKYNAEQREKEIALRDAEIVEKDLRDKKRNTQLTFSLVGLVVILVMSGFVYRGYLQKQKSNVLITEQKGIVEDAFAQLEEKNKEITDSIQYAKRIQNAILPPKKVVKEYLQDSFILYKPKDIVAGDFYWLEHYEGNVLFAAADCTGHGVPGAMVSVVCNNGLNRSVREFGLTDPGEILNRTRELIIAEFEKSEDEVKDGMDIALCKLEIPKDKSQNAKLEYAGANNPLWIIRKQELIEIKANKQPIGQFDNPEPYTTHTIELEKGDSIYIFSDGYVDQFGGEKGKKFKAQAFRTLLLSIQDKPMEEQQKIINTAFEDWRGNLEQIDDVCVIGVRV